MKFIPQKYDTIKRGMDIVGASIGLVLLSPVIGIIALLVRTKLGAPVLFTQDRPGLNGQIFTIYKFRSMRDVDEANGLIEDADRLTKFGKALRSTSLDELPSLVNVLKGDMSIVGPRPLLVEYLGYYSTEQSKRHEVRPGITGHAQVSGRNSISWDEKFKLDVDYVDSRSFTVDLKIIIKTIITVITRRGINHVNHATMTKFGDNSEN